MKRLLAAATAAAAARASPTCLGFTVPAPPRPIRPPSDLTLSVGRGSASPEDGPRRPAAPVSRREALRSSSSAAAAAAAALVAAAAFPHPPEARADIEGVVTPSGIDGAAGAAAPALPAPVPAEGKGGGVTLFQTRSGLKYIDLREGTGQSPRYGQLVSVSYKAFVKLPDIKGEAQKPVEFDSDRAYLIKHGNGRTVPGLDEGIHTMRVGGKRRIIIPPKLGYVQPGIGPIPEGPLARRRLNGLLDKMVEVRGGNVVFDVELRTVMDDEADQGYYEDGSLSPEDFNRLRANLQSAGIEARAAGLREVQPDDV